MSYTFPNLASTFAGDAGAGNTKGAPIFILGFARVTSFGSGAGAYGAGILSGADDFNNSMTLRQIGIDSPNARFGAMNADDSGNIRITAPTVAVSSVDDVWFGFGGKTVNNTNGVGYVGSTSASATISTNLSGNTSEGYRYVRVGRSTESAIWFGDRKLAEVVFGFFDPTNQELDDYFGGTSAITAFAGKSFWYYPLLANSTSHADASGNGGPTISATGSVSWNEDHPTISSPLLEFIPYMPALYRGATRLDNRSNIQYAITLGHSSLTGSSIAAGNTGTTDGSGIFQLPSPIIDPELSDEDPVTVKLHWTEGSDPELSHSVVHKTILTEVV